MSNYTQHDDQYRHDVRSQSALRLQPRYENDSALWNAFRNGDDGAIAVILERFSNELYKYGCKVLNDREIVKDSIQDLFVQLYRNRSSLGETCAIKLYLFKALRRRLFRAKSREKSLRALLSSYQHDAGIVSESPEYNVMLHEVSVAQKETVKFLMAKLTVRQHEAIYLRYYEELDYDTIANVMEIRKQAVYNLVHEAIEFLRNNLGR